jgi:hypothetical protein
MNQAAAVAEPETQKPEEKVGRFEADQNIYWNPTKPNQPRYKGKLTLPNNAEPRAVSLWVNIAKENPDEPDKKRNVYMSGTVTDTTSAALDKMAHQAPPLTEEQKLELVQHTADGYAVKPYSINLFQAKNYDPAKQQPNLYGYYNPGDGTPLQRVDVWMRPKGKDRNGNDMFSLSGKVSEYDFDDHMERIKKREAEKANGAPEHAHPENLPDPPPPGNDNEEEEDDEPQKKRGRGR